MKRSLSRKRNPYDKTVAEATDKIIKTAYPIHKIFDRLEQLQYLLFDYVNRVNHFLMHSSLGDLSSEQYKLKNIKYTEFFNIFLSYLGLDI